MSILSVARISALCITFNELAPPPYVNERRSCSCPPRAGAFRLLLACLHVAVAPCGTGCTPFLTRDSSGCKVSPVVDPLTQRQRWLTIPPRICHLSRSFREGRRYPSLN